MCSARTPAYPRRFAAIPSPSHRASASPAARTCARPRSWSSRIALRMSRPGSKQAKRMSSSLAWWKRSAYDRTKSRPSRTRARSASDRASKRSMTAGRTARNRLMCPCSSTSAFIGGEYESFRVVSGPRFRGSGSATTWPGDTIPAIPAISVPSSSGERLWISTMSASRHVPTLHGTHPMRYSSRRAPTGGYFPMISLIGVRRYFSMCAPPMAPILPQGRHAVLDADQPGIRQSSEGETGLRTRFVSLRSCFPSRRRSLDPAVGRVFLRGLTGAAAFSSHWTRRSLASWRFRSRVRKRLASMTSTPSPVTRFPASRISRSRTPSGRDRELRTSKRSWTAVATLLTFCPPGPEERMNRSSMSPSSTAIFPSICPFFHCILRFAGWRYFR